MKSYLNVMSRFHTPVSFGDDIDKILEVIESADQTESHALLTNLKKACRTDTDIVTVLAMSSAKWIDHSGPYIGHGILNADPTLRSVEMMGNKGDLALLQMTMYVTELLRHPNYGPYVMQKINGIGGSSGKEISTEFSKAIRSGSNRYLSEKLLSGLYSSAGKGIRDYILYEALMQYGENEHRLLLPYHTLKLLDRESNWDHAVSLLRPSVQYLASHPDISHGVKAQQLSKLVSFDEITDRGNSFDQENAYDLTRMLLNSILGNEMTILADYSKTSSLQDMYEAIALTSTILLLNSDLEQHSVTGKHCILSMIKDKKLSERIRTVALLSALEGPRARRIKAYIIRSLDAYLKIPEIKDVGTEEDLLTRIESEVMKGQQETAFKLAASYVRSGMDTDKLTAELLSLCFRTEGPFESMHTSKMLVGMRDVTISSKSDMKWLHLAAASRFVAEMAKKEKAGSKAPNEQYMKYVEISGTA